MNYMNTTACVFLLLLAGSVPLEASGSEGSSTGETAEREANENAEDVCAGVVPSVRRTCELQHAIRTREPVSPERAEEAAREIRRIIEEVPRKDDPDDEGSVTWSQQKELGKAIADLGTTRDPRWIPLIEELWEQYREFRWLIAGPSGEISTVASTALVNLMWPKIEEQGLVDWLREVWAAEPKPGSLMRSASSEARRRLISKYGWNSPELASLWEDEHPSVRRSALGGMPLRDTADIEVLARWVDFLNDPDEEIRRFMARRISFRPIGGDILVEPLRRFLERDDLREKAEKTAMRALQVRGWTVEETKEGLEAVQLDAYVEAGDKKEWRLRVYLEWLTDSEAPWGSSMSFGLLFSAMRPVPSEKVPLVLEFLARDDIDDDVREIATRLLSLNRYAPATGPSGCLIAVPENGGPPILQEDCRPQDEP